MQHIDSLADYLSIYEIIENASENNFEINQTIYKLNTKYAKMSNPKVKTSASQDRIENSTLGIQDSFFKIRVKQQTYLGQQATVILLNDITKKIHCKVNTLQH